MMYNYYCCYTKFLLLMMYNHCCCYITFLFLMVSDHYNYHIKVACDQCAYQHQRQGFNCYHSNFVDVFVALMLLVLIFLLLFSSRRISSNDFITHVREEFYCYGKHLFCLPFHTWNGRPHGTFPRGSSAEINQEAFKSLR